MTPPDATNRRTNTTTNPGPFVVPGRREHRSPLSSATTIVTRPAPLLCPSPPPPGPIVFSSLRFNVSTLLCRHRLNLLAFRYGERRQQTRRGLCPVSQRPDKTYVARCSRGSSTGHALAAIRSGVSSCPRVVCVLVALCADPFAVSISSLVITSSRKRSSINIVPNAFPASRLSATRPLGENAPIEFVQVGKPRPVDSLRVSRSRG